MTNVIGLPLEKGFKLLPKNWKVKVGDITRTALSKAFDAAFFTLKNTPGSDASTGWHKLLVSATGGLGGAFGLGALALELPISTTLMARSIADIARSEGEQIGEVGCKMACMEVFALGAPGKGDDAAETGYFATRAALARSISQAAEYLAEKGVAEKGAPAIVRLIVQISQRFSVQVSEKAAAQAVPVIGAAGGAIINALFMDHFQTMARGHFIVRRLERKYGKDAVRKQYESL